MGRAAGVGSGRLDVSRPRPLDGWTRPQQWARLRHVATNARFLILPGVPIAHRASKTLALTTRRLAADGKRWARRAALPAQRHYVRHGHPQTVWIRPLTPAAPAVLAAPFLPPTLQGGALTTVDGNAPRVGGL